MQIWKFHCCRAQVHIFSTGSLFACPCFCNSFWSGSPVEDECMSVLSSCFEDALETEGMIVFAVVLISNRLYCIPPLDWGGQEERSPTSGSGGQATAESEILQATGWGSCECQIFNTCITNMRHTSNTFSNTRELVSMMQHDIMTARFLCGSSRHQFLNVVSFRKSRPTLTCPGTGRCSMRWRRLRSALTSPSPRSTSWEQRVVKLAR